MPTATPARELKAFKRFVKEATDRYLTPHLANAPLAHPTRAEALDGAACVVLVHGALENLSEGLALWVMRKVEATWIYRKRATRSMAAMLLYASPPKLEDQVDGTLTVFDNLRLALEEAKKTGSNQVEKNHGVALKHLRSLLLPVGINVTNDAQLTASLEKLVSMRHEWAHQYRFGAKKSRSAQDVKLIVDDCVKMAEKLAADVAAARP